jgi:leader peptidase (prepilin peptidase)/N-methyltransferase
MIFAAGVLGAIVGSFLNALSFRLGTGRSVMRGRSHCMRCGKTLTAIDLVPIVSYLCLRGRCRHCGVRISIQYPLVEAAAAALGAAVFALNADPLQFALWFVAWMTLLFVVVYDLRHFIIPWSCSIVLALLGLAHVWMSGLGIWSVAAGPALAAPLLLLSLVSRGRWMGWGDGALQLGLGWLLGPTMGLTGLVLGFWSGAAVGIVLLAAQKGYTMKSELPFAPFLILGAGVAYFFHVDIFSTLPALFH